MVEFAFSILYGDGNDPSDNGRDRPDPISSKSADDTSFIIILGAMAGLWALSLPLAVCVIVALDGSGSGASRLECTICSSSRTASSTLGSFSGNLFVSLRTRKRLLRLRLGDADLGSMSQCTAAR